MKMNIIAMASHADALQSNGQEQQQFWEFKNSATETSEASLYIYGDIVTYDLGNWNFPDDVVPNKFKDELNALGDVSTIHVHINSNGGSVFAAYAIMNLLINHKAYIITYNDGICASAATIIAMAGSKIISAVGSVWLYHLPLAGLCGYYNVKDLRNVTDWLNTILESMLDIYTSRTGMDRDKLEKMLNEETPITGTEAHKLGLVDEINQVKIVAFLSDDKKAVFFNGVSIDVSNFRNKEKLIACLPASKPGTVSHSNMPLINNSIKAEEEIIVDLNELKAKYPEIYNAAVQEGVNQGVAAERKRIMEIEDMSLPGTEDLSAKAKFESGVTAAEFAIDLIKNQKQKGSEYLSAAKSDATPLDKVPAGATPPMDDAQEAQMLLAKAKAHADIIRR